jgi:NADH-quinone oxidoreductase subunit E
MTIQTPPTYQLSTKLRKAIDACVAKFPQGKQRSAVIMALRLLQNERGWLADEQLDALACYLNLAKIEVYEVVSFYSMFDRTPVGKHKIAVCNSISCHLCGSKKLIDHLKKRLKIELGQTTSDGLFTLKETECLAACDGAPAMMVDETTYEENVTPERADQLIETLRKAAQRTKKKTPTKEKTS